MSDDAKGNSKKGSDWEAPRRTPEIERLLTQFTNHDGPKGASEKYRTRYEAAFCEHAFDNVGTNPEPPGRCWKCGWWIDAEGRPVEE